MTNIIDTLSMLDAGDQKWSPAILNHKSNRRFSVLAAFGALLLVGTAAHASATASGGYRLAGVIDSGVNNRMGFLELPQGGQVLIRLGTVIAGGGKVVEFSNRAVRIAFPDGHSVNIDFVGAAHGAAETATVQSVSHPIENNPAVSKLEDHGQSLIRHITVANFNKQLGTEGPAGADLTERLRNILKLPVDAKIVAVNDAPVTSTASAIQKIQTKFAGNFPATLNLQSPSGWQRVYLMPELAARQ